MRRALRAISLVEVMVANAILATLMVMTLSFATSLSDSSSVAWQYATLHQDANRVIEELAHSLRSARIAPREQNLNPNHNFQAMDSLNPGAVDPTDLTVNDLGSATSPTQAGQIVFQVPVDWDDDFDATGLQDDGLGTITHIAEWGAQREDRPAGLIDWRDAFMMYRFVAQRQFSEAARNVDLNQDGDVVDTFDIGRLEIVYSSGGIHAGQAQPASNAVTVNMLSGNSIVRVAGQMVGNIDGNETDPAKLDPIFSLNGSVLTITLFTARPEERIPILIKTQTSIELRNR